MAATDPALELPEESVAPEPAGRTLVRGAARSLLITPWFAASAGVVIAAGLWIHAPHTVLRFPNSTPLTVPCTGKGCSTGGNGQPNVSLPGQAIKDRPPAARHPAARRAKERGEVKGIAFTYALAQHGDTFTEVITVSGRRLPARWTLWFEIPAVRITRVLGVHWQLWASKNGGAATPDRSRLSGHGRHWVTFLVFGSGTATSPVSCTFDTNESCSFTEATGGGQDGWPGGDPGQGGNPGRDGGHGQAGRSGSGG